MPSQLPCGAQTLLRDMFSRLRLVHTKLYSRHNGIGHIGRHKKPVFTADDHIADALALGADGDAAAGHSLQIYDA